MAPFDVRHIRLWRSRFLSSGDAKTSAVQACRRDCDVLAIFDLVDSNTQIDGPTDQPQFWGSQHHSNLASDGTGDRVHIADRAAAVRLGCRKQAGLLVDPDGDLPEPLTLGARCYAVHLEEAAFRPATAEFEFIVAIGLNPLPGGVFKMIEDDVAGQSLLA